MLCNKGGKQTIVKSILAVDLAKMAFLSPPVRNEWCPINTSGEATEHLTIILN